MLDWVLIDRMVFGLDHARPSGLVLTWLLFGATFGVSISMSYMLACLSQRFREFGFISASGFTLFRGIPPLILIFTVDYFVAGPLLMKARIVAQSGLTHAILRPSVIIGDSRTGDYFGKRYGLYQLWEGAKRLLPEKVELLRLASPQARMNFLHQDAFSNVALKVMANPLANSVINIVSTKDSSPTVEDLWQALFEAIGWPETLEWVPDNASLDYNGLSHRIKAFNAFCRTNIEIASRDWTFERSTVDRMIAAGMAFPEAKIDTIRVCQSHFLDRYKQQNGRVFNA